MNPGIESIILTQYFEIAKTLIVKHSDSLVFSVLVEQKRSMLDEPYGGIHLRCPQLPFCDDMCHENDPMFRLMFSEPVSEKLVLEACQNQVKGDGSGQDVTVSALEVEGGYGMWKITITGMARQEEVLAKRLGKVGRPLYEVQEDVSREAT
jgi:hypothetical protein